MQKIETKKFLKKNFDLIKILSEYKKKGWKFEGVFVAFTDSYGNKGNATIALDSSVVFRLIHEAKIQMKLVELEVEEFALNIHQGRIDSLDKMTTKSDRRYLG